MILGAQVHQMRNSIRLCCTDDLILKTRHSKNQHSLAFQIPYASKDVFKYSLFPKTIRGWNDLPESLISSSKLSDDSVSTKKVHLSCGARES